MTPEDVTAKGQESVPGDLASLQPPGPDRAIPKYLLAGIGLVAGLAVGWLIFFGLPGEPTEIGLLPTVEGNAAGLEIAPRQGAEAPDFELQSSQGELVRLADLRGTPVLINFWATWCGPCRIEMPSIQAQFEKHTPGLKVLAVNFDESEAEVDAFVEEFGLTFDVLLDPGGEVNENIYRVRGYPSSYFIDQDGIVQVVHIGIMTETQLVGYLKQLGLSP